MNKTVRPFCLTLKMVSVFLYHAVCCLELYVLVYTLGMSMCSCSPYYFLPAWLFLNCTKYLMLFHGLPACIIPGLPPRHGVLQPPRQFLHPSNANIVPGRKIHRFGKKFWPNNIQFVTYLPTLYFSWHSLT